MDGKSVIRELKKAGWEHVSTQGSHYKMKKNGKPPIIVPVHGKKDLKPGTLSSIERNAGIKIK